MRSSCFAEEDVGLSSVSGTSSNNTMNNPCLSRSRRANSYRSLSSLSYSSSSFSSRLSARLFDVRGEEHQPHFLEACFLCKAPLGDNRDIFMYRGDTPFCTEECRQEQIEIDEAKENKLKLSYSMKAMRNEITKTTSNKSQNYQARTNPVAAS